MTIKAVKAREILDSRGNPTAECEIKTETGTYRASVPSGASTGTHEAKELRDCEKRFFGMGVRKAINNINTTIARKLKGKKTKQEEIDSLLINLDGTKDKSRLGANAMLAVSMAAARAEAGKEPLYKHIAEIYGTKRMTLPVPAFNIINGGKHSGNRLDIQEYMIMPTGAKSFAEALQIGSEVYHLLKKDLQNKLGKQAVNVGDEGGFAPQLTCMEEPFDYITDAIMKLGYWKKVKLAIDSAASTMWKDGVYWIEGREMQTEELMEKYEELVNSYPLISIEDPFYEEDFENFARLKKNLKIQIVGDDLLTTNTKRIQKAINADSCNCLLLKINQIGTITEALNAAKMAEKAGWNVMTSHRSGETEDTFIADLAVGIASGQIKSGAPSRGERTAKYNQLLRIEEELGRKARYAGK